MDQPNDLVTLRDAATMIERSPRTIRRWITEGKLSRHEGQTPDNGGSAPALVSTSALLGLVASTGQQPRADAGGPDGQQVVDTGGSKGGGTLATHPDMATSAEVELATLRGEVALARARGEHAAVEVERDALARQVAELQARLEGEAARLEEADRRHRLEVAELREDRDDWRDRHDATRAELDALRLVTAERDGTSWWRRLIGGPVTALPGEVPEAK